MITAKILFKGLITNLIFSAILFLCAGRIDYYQGWVFLSVNILSTILNVFSIRKNTDLMKERSGFGKDIKSWDKLLLSASAVIYLILIVTAGLDSGRFLWSGELNRIISFSGAAVLLTGQIIFITARSQNNFFSSVMRIQKDRGHVVCDKGLYEIIRHPGYLGMILSLLAIPLITVSFWSFIPALSAVALLLIRTSLEDKTLKDELDGYVEYSKKTRYKLIPFIW